MYVNVMVAPRLKKSFIHLFVVILTIAESSEIVIGAGSTVPCEGFDLSVIMPFSWCVVAVALPI